ncbi:MAG: prepilin-type N-terminal cleavage/methylation domain-containing protein [bacterium]|nr:prepilin-type N-terminal cleavage/methylation domain-containing protein [bacterium]
MSIKKHFRLSRGFTLVELLVVIAIIGILATLLLLQLGVARSRARDAKRIADVNQIRTAAELYYDDNGMYPQFAIAGLEAVLKPRYLTQMPVDPLNVAPYVYGYAFNGNTKYQVFANLEQWAQALSSDADIDASVAPWSGGVDGALDDKAGCLIKTTVTCIYDQGQN